jgi:hypothetical protein
MDRTIPSFRNVLAMEKADWNPFRNALDRSERKEFDDMFDIPRLYLTTCSNSVQLVPLHPIIISILFHHYKELTEIISEVEKMEKNSTTTTVNSSGKKKKEKELTIEEGKEKEHAQEESPPQSKLLNF